MACWWAWHNGAQRKKCLALKFGPATKNFLRRTEIFVSIFDLRDLKNRQGEKFSGKFGFVAGDFKGGKRRGAEASFCKNSLVNCSWEIFKIPFFRSRKIKVFKAQETGPKFSILTSAKIPLKSLSLKSFPPLLKRAKMSSTCVEQRQKFFPFLKINRQASAFNSIKPQTEKKNLGGVTSCVRIVLIRKEIF